MAQSVQSLFTQTNLRASAAVRTLSFFWELYVLCREGINRRKTFYVFQLDPFIANTNSGQREKFSFLFAESNEILR